MSRDNRDHLPTLVALLGVLGVVFTGMIIGAIVVAGIVLR